MAMLNKKIIMFKNLQKMLPYSLFNLKKISNQLLSYSNLKYSYFSHKLQSFIKIQKSSRILSHNYKNKITTNHK